MSREQTFNFAVWSSFIHSLKNSPCLSSPAPLPSILSIWFILVRPSHLFLLSSSRYMTSIPRRKSDGDSERGAEEARLSSVRDGAKRHTRWGRETLSHHLENERKSCSDSENFLVIYFSPLCSLNFFRRRTRHLLTLEEWGEKIRYSFNSFLLSLCMDCLKKSWVHFSRSREERQEPTDTKGRERMNFKMRGESSIVCWEERGLKIIYSSPTSLFVGTNINCIHTIWREWLSEREILLR